MRISDWSAGVCSSDLIFQHREPVDADAEGKALPFVGVESAVRDHAAIDHAAAEQFHPRMARVVAVAADDAAALFLLIADIDRSEERRGGTECVSPCRSRWSPDH